MTPLPRDPRGDAEHWRHLAERRVLTGERDHMIRLFNRLEAAVSHHKAGKSDLIVDEVDEALYAARDKILKTASE